MRYHPPPREGLRLLKEQLSYTNAQMADLFGIATGRQFHKYLSDEDKRDMGFHVLMYGMVQLQLQQGPIKNIEQLFARARVIGATIELEDGEQQP